MDTDLPFHIKKLEYSDQFYAWEREMEQYLIAYSLDDYTTQPLSAFPERVTQAVVDSVRDANNSRPATEQVPLPDIEPVKNYETRQEKWKGKQKICCNTITSTLGTDYYHKYRHYKDGHSLMTAIRSECRPKGSGALYNRYCRLLDLKLSDCKGPYDYMGQIKALVCTVQC